MHSVTPISHPIGTRKKKQGKTIRVVDIQLDTMIEMDTEPLLDISKLNQAPLDRMHWSTQCSGIHIPTLVAQSLEEQWEEHIRQVKHTRKIEGPYL